jgi:hypothetical protein
LRTSGSWEADISAGAAIVNGPGNQLSWLGLANCTSLPGGRQQVCFRSGSVEGCDGRGHYGADVKRTTRRKITVETERLLVVSSRQEAAAWCEQCGTEMKMVDPRAAAAISGLSARAIFRRVESGQLHFTETADGALLICLNSLMKQT